VWNEAARWLLGAEATAQHYQEIFALDLQPYQGWWVETGRDSALSGIAQARRAIQPIFTIRCSHRGHYYAVRQEIKGFCLPDETVAWVSTVAWEALLGDDQFAQLDAAADDVARRALRLAEGTTTN